MDKVDSGYWKDKMVSKKLRAYLGSNKCTLEYEKKMTSSAERFGEYNLPGLYAIIIPSGGGKSTLCKEFGFIDVDNVIGNQDAMERLILERREMIRWGQDRWAEHNEEWYGMVRGVLQRYDFETNPQIILLHTEEMAYEIGACPLVALVPHDALQKERLRSRNTLERMLAIDNLHVVKQRTKTSPIITYDNWLELRQLASYYAYTHMHLPAPFRAFERQPKRGWPIGYSRDTPMWVLQGRDINEESVRVVQKLYEEGAVPDVCYSYYTEKLFGIKDANVRSVYDTERWIQTCGLIHGAGLMGKVDEKLLMKKDLSLVYPYESKMAQNKRGVGLRRLLENVDAMKNPVMRDVLLNRGGSNQNLVVSLIVWIGGVMKNLRPLLQDRVLNSGILLIPDKDWIKIVKQIHDLVRTTGTFFGVPLNKYEMQRLMYMHMLYGRFVYKVDEMEEISKRKRELDGVKLAYKDGEWSAEEYDRLELAGIRDAYKRLCDSVPSYKVGNFIEFWKQRRSWTAKGSTVLHEGEKKYMIKVVNHIVKQLELRHNKKSLFEDPVECNRVISEIINRMGRNDSRVVPKYESAAKRALLPGNLYHYVVFSYVLWIFENCASVGDVRLGNKRDESFAAFDSKLETNLTRFVYDFSDFNAQHSRKSMARVISLLGECVDPSDTLNFCLKWLSLSFGQMEIIDSEGKRHEVKSGLYSGWRGTTWINSVLNHAYMYVARACYQRLVGTDPFVEYEGAGDDVDGVVRDIAAAGRLYNITIEMGLESNTLKQLFGSKAEFLRVTYERGYAGASVCRGLGNFVSGNWEGEGGSISEKLTVAIDNVLALGRRGLDELMVRVLYRCVLAHYGRIFDGDEWVPLSAQVLHGRMEDGGFGIPDSEGCIWRLEKPAPAPEGWQGYLRLPHKSASADWADIIENETREKGIVIGNRDGLIEALARDSYDVKNIAHRFGTELSPEVWKKYWLHECKVLEKIPIETIETNQGFLMEFLEWLGTEETPSLNKLEKLDIVGQYVQYLVKSDGRELTEEEWYGEMYQGHLRVQAMSMQRWGIVKCPPVVQSKVARWCKEFLANGMWTGTIARRAYQIICNTYGEVFGMEM